MSDTISQSTVDSICFRRNDFNLYAFLLFCIIMYLCFVLKKYRETFVETTSDNVNAGLKREHLLERLELLQDKLFSCQTSQQKCLGDLQQTRQYIQQSQSGASARQGVENKANVNIALNRLYNPHSPPERSYPSGRLNTPGTSDFQQIGIVYNNTERLPLFGRPKYPGRTEKYEYYIIDETRNRLKIPFKSKNDNELYDGDTIHLDILNNDYNVKIYEYDQFRYDPDIL
jgi:hypothetical protein